MGIMEGFILEYWNNSSMMSGVDAFSSVSTPRGIRQGSTCLRM